MTTNAKKSLPFVPDFAKADILIATKTSQGLQAGQLYRVADLKVIYTSSRSLLTVYRLVDGQVDLLVINLFRLAVKATEEQRDKLMPDALRRLVQQEVTL